MSQSRHVSAGLLIGAIGLSGPSSRMSDQRIAQMGARLIEISAAPGRVAAMTATQPDHGKLIGMSLMAGRDDIEVAAATVRELGFEGMEVHASQIGPGLPGVPVFEAHAAAVGDVIRRAGLIVSTLNVVGDATFDPFGGPDALTTTIEGLASHMRWAAAMGAPRILIWEGRIAKRDDINSACDTLAQGDRSGRAPQRTRQPAARFVRAASVHLRAEIPGAAAARCGAPLGRCRHLLRLLPFRRGAWRPARRPSRRRRGRGDRSRPLSPIPTPGHRSCIFRSAKVSWTWTRSAAKLAGKPIALSWDLFGWPGPRRAVRAAHGHLSRLRRAAGGERQAMAAAAAHA